MFDDEKQLLAEDLELWDRRRCAAGGMARVLAIEQIRLDEPQPVYNFTVRGPHTYFVLDTGVLVHNAACKRLGAGDPPEWGARLAQEIDRFYAQMPRWARKNSTIAIAETDGAKYISARGPALDYIRKLDNGSKLSNYDFADNLGPEHAEERLYNHLERRANAIAVSRWKGPCGPESRNCAEFFEGRGTSRCLGQGSIRNNNIMSKQPSSYRVSQLAGLLFELGTTDLIDDITRRWDVYERIRQFTHSELAKAGALVLNMVCEQNTKFYTIELLVEDEPDLVLPFLLESLHSTYPDVRRWSCGMLAETGSLKAANRLMYVLVYDPSADVRVIAAYALGRIGDPRALPALIQASENDREHDFDGIAVSDVAQEAVKKIRQK